MLKDFEGSASEGGVVVRTIAAAVAAVKVTVKLVGDGGLRGSWDLGGGAFGTVAAAVVAVVEEEAVEKRAEGEKRVAMG